MQFCFTQSFSPQTTTKSLKVGYSDDAIRPCCDIGIDAFSTPSSTPQAPSSWPPRPALTGLSPTCVAAHVVPIFQVRSVSAVSRQPPTINSPFTSPPMMSSSRCRPVFDIFFVVIATDNSFNEFVATPLYILRQTLYILKFSVNSVLTKTVCSP